jgi:hypothetical protein
LKDEDHDAVYALAIQAVYTTKDKEKEKKKSEIGRVMLRSHLRHARIGSAVVGRWSGVRDGAGWALRREC